MVTHHPHPAHTTPPAAAVEPGDPTLVTDWEMRQSFALIPFDVVDGRPVNPVEPHRSAGRNGLDLWGENLIANTFVTAGDTDGSRWLLMIEHAHDPGCWALPGGAVNDGEMPFAAALREVEEQTALRLNPALCFARSPRYMPDPQCSREAWIVTTPVVAHLHIGDGPLPTVIGWCTALRAAWLPADSYDALAENLATLHCGRIDPAHRAMLRDLLSQPGPTPPAALPGPDPAIVATAAPATQQPDVMTETEADDVLVDVALADELAGLRAIEPRADTKAGQLLSLTSGLLVAGMAAFFSGKLTSLTAVAGAGLAQALLLTAAVLLTAAMRPQLGGNFGFPRWARAASDAEVLAALAAARATNAGKTGQLRWLSRSLHRKFTRIRSAHTLIVAALIIAAITAALAMAGR
jgi:ADP-ribose pyrophosphatase